jgi:hypothetical protein
MTDAVGLFARFVARADNVDPAAAPQFGASIAAALTDQREPVG